MNAPSSALQIEANAPLTHILLSLDLLETSEMTNENRCYLAIIRQNIERLQSLIAGAAG
jgi:hypothetical protein